MNKIIFNDNLKVLKQLESESIDLIYIDPPFNTGNTQKRVQTTGEIKSYNDSFLNYMEFLIPRLEEAYRVLKNTGTLYFHIDYREVHYCKVYLDTLFGRQNFLNEVIWAYDYGARTKKRWAAKHDNILVYVKNRNSYIFNYDDIDKIPYMSPGLVGPEKVAKGKTPTDSWFHTIVPTNGKEKTGYPTQKPLGIIRRIILASSPPDGLVLDFFAGSGTVGMACLELGRNFILVDNNMDAIKTMQERFKDWDNIEWNI